MKKSNFTQSFQDLSALGKSSWLASLLMLVMLFALPSSSWASNYVVSLTTPSGSSATFENATGTGNDYSIKVTKWTSGNFQFRVNITQDERKWPNDMQPYTAEYELSVNDESSSSNKYQITSDCWGNSNYFKVTASSDTYDYLTVHVDGVPEGNTRYVYVTGHKKSTSGGETGGDTGVDTKTNSYCGLTPDASNSTGVSTLNFSSDQNGWGGDALKPVSNGLYRYTFDASGKTNADVWFRLTGKTGSNGLCAPYNGAVISVGNGSTISAGSAYAQSATIGDPANRNLNFHFNTGVEFSKFFIEAVLVGGKWYVSVTGDPNNKIAYYEISTSTNGTTFGDWTTFISGSTLNKNVKAFRLHKVGSKATSYFAKEVGGSQTISTDGTPLSVTLYDGAGDTGSQFCNFQIGSSDGNVYGYKLTIGADDNQLTLNSLYEHTVYIYNNSNITSITQITGEGAAKDLQKNSTLTSKGGFSWYQYKDVTTKKEQNYSIGSVSGIKSSNADTYWEYNGSSISSANMTKYQWRKSGSVTWNDLKTGSAQNWESSYLPFNLRQVSVKNDDFTTLYYKTHDANNTVYLPLGTAYTVITTENESEEYTFSNSRDSKDNINGEMFGYSLTFDPSSNLLTLSAQSTGTAMFILAGKNITEKSHIYLYKGSSRIDPDNTDAQGVAITSLDTYIDNGNNKWYVWKSINTTGVSVIFNENSFDAKSGDKTVPEGISFWYWDGTQAKFEGKMEVKQDNFTVYQYSPDDESTWNVVLNGSTVYSGYMPMKLRKFTFNYNTTAGLTENFDYFYTGKTNDVVTFSSSNSSANTSLGSDKTLSATSATNFTVDTSDDAFRSDRGYTLGIDDSHVSLTKLDKTHWYWVSPELTGGERKEYFRLKPQRTRSGSDVDDNQYYDEKEGELSNMYYAMNLKTADIKDMLSKTENYKNATQIHYWIEDENGNKYTCYTTQSNVNLFNYTNDKGASMQITRGKDGNVVINEDQADWNNSTTKRGYGTTEVAKGSNLGDNQKFLLDLSNGVSFTWFWAYYNNNDVSYQQLQQATNKAALAEEKNTAGEYSYFVIGNFNNQEQGGSWNPTQISGRRQMTRYIYYTNGKPVADSKTEVKLNTSDNKYYTYVNNAYTTNEVDSVVYTATIQRPNVGWSNLYLCFAPSNQVSKTTDFTTSDWNTIIRPEGQWYGTKYTNGTDKAPNEGMDLSSLRGGLYQGSNTNLDNYGVSPDLRNQALDPVVDAYQNATSYTVSMNMTTSTYRIFFNTKQLYIVGRSVMPNKDGNWYNHDDRIKHLSVKIGGRPEDWYALPLTLTSNGTYMYLKDGKETPIVMQETWNGKASYFRFAYIEGDGDDADFVGSWFGEDKNAPVELNDPKDEYKAVGGDTPYYNHLSEYDAESKNNVEDGTTLDNGNNSNKNIEWRLPSNKFYIRFHISSDSDTPQYYYEVVRDFYFTDLGESDPYSIRANVFNGDRYFRVFSDVHAHELPSGVHMYVVTAVDFAKNTITIRPMGGYIPANTGVLLGVKDITANPYLSNYTDGTNQGLALRLPLYSKPDNDGFQESTANLFKASITPMDMPASFTDAQGNVTYNYMFWQTEEYGAGFYIPVDNYKMQRNTAYLSLSAQPNKVADVGEKEKTGGAKSFAFGFVDWNNDTPTGINDIEKQHANNGVYYTVGGVQVTKPLKKGVYIHNGKKIVVR